MLHHFHIYREICQPPFFHGKTSLLNSNKSKIPLGVEAQQCGSVSLIWIPFPLTLGNREGEYRMTFIPDTSCIDLFQ